ncbi:MAG: hypothetical protein KDJ74_16025 [Notoacmeibacter sp.]|nr:hypothetical protein [Notoacmeibacter sp.]
MRTLQAFGLLTAVLIHSPLAIAQDGPVAMAFAVAPEQAYGECSAASPKEAADCAMKQCIDGGAAEEDCALVASCFPVGWTARLGIQHSQGPHWPEYHCGWDSREALEAAMAIACDLKRRKELTMCEITQIWDGDGKPQMEE